MKRLIFIALMLSALLVTPALAMENPLHATTQDGLLENICLYLPAPGFAHSVAWFYYDDPDERYADINSPCYHQIGEMRFTTEDGTEYSYRVRPTHEFTDISGMFYEWTEVHDVEVLYEQAKCYSNGKGQAMIQWYAVVPGLMYSLSVSENADTEVLADVANRLYEPAQGDVG